MRFIDSDREFPISSAVVHGGKVFEAVVTGIPDGSHTPVAGGVEVEFDRDRRGGVAGHVHLPDLPSVQTRLRCVAAPDRGRRVPQPSVAAVLQRRVPFLARYDEAANRGDPVGGRHAGILPQSHLQRG